MKTYSFYQTFNGSLKKVLVISADPFNWDGDPETLAIVKNIMAENGLYLTHYDDLQKLPDLFKGSNITCIADAILVKATWDEEKHPRDHGRFAGKSAGQAHAILTTENSGHIDRLKSHIQHEGAKGGHDWSHVGNQHHIATKLDELDFEGKRPIPTTSRLDPESAHKDLARHNVAQLDTLAAHNAHVAQTPDAHWGHVGSAEHINRSLADLNDFAHGEGEYADTVPAHGGPDIEDNKPHPKEPTRASTEAKQDRKAWDDQAYQPLPKSEPKAAGPLAGKGKMKRFQHGPAAQGAAAAAPAASKPQAGTFQAHKDRKSVV
jgi:hypothetical protein